jgi:valyl-tRNA synthetase
MMENPPKATEFAKAYDPQQIELRWAQAWVEQGLYTPEVGAKLRAPDPQRGTFCIVIPPPNVTGSIHIGHMLEHAQIDVLTRWQRMGGFGTLWLRAWITHKSRRKSWSSVTGAQGVAAGWAR